LAHTIDLALALETARKAVTAAAAVALGYFRHEMQVDWKEDRTPVTAADKAAERAILEAIRTAFPEHSILTEETGEISGDPEARWIIDPIDGTRGFARGGLFWGPLVALEHRGEIVAGAMGLPALKETYWAARGVGCYRDGERLRVSAVASLCEATICLGEMRNLFAGEYAPGVLDLVAKAASTRCPGDVGGCAQLLSGRAEAWLESGVKPWDIAAARILIEEAGGRVTDFDGNPKPPRNRVLATNGHLHDGLLAVLARSRTA